MEEREQLGAVERDPVALGLLGEGVVDAGLPVDQRAVHIECDEGDVLWERHRARHYDLRRDCGARSDPRCRTRRVMRIFG